MSVAGETRPQQPHLPPSRSSSSSHPKPKGILKNARDSSIPPSGGHQHNLQWDEENLALTEINKDSLMKITEPKTPYVRYNALTDEIEGDIPDFSLSGGYSSQGFRDEPMSPEAINATLADDAASPPSRRTSISSAPGRAGSGTSSRSTSFNLPNEARKDIRLDATPGADEVEVDEEEMDEETAAKHAAFVRARKGHYSNEAEAMKKAAQLMAEEDDDLSSSNAPSDVNDEDDDGESNFDDDDEPVQRGRVIPPVPPLPAHINGKNAGPPSSNN